MWKYTVKVDGMMCGMCEAHANDAMRRAFPNLKKVSSSHSKGETTIITPEELDEEVIKSSITELGYDIGPITKEPYEKKGFFGLF